VPDVPARQVPEDGEQRAERAQRAAETGVERGVLDKQPCSIRLVRATRTDAAFHDFDAYERLLKVARSIDPHGYLIALRG
jgi:hypothetical protein